MPAQLGQILDQKIQTKNPTATSEEPKQKNKNKKQKHGIRSKSRVLHMPLEKAVAPTPVLSPGKSHGGKSLVGCSPWGC